MEEVQLRLFPLLSLLVLSSLSEKVAGLSLESTVCTWRPAPLPFPLPLLEHAFWWPPPKKWHSGHCNFSFRYSLPKWPSCWQLKHLFLLPVFTASMSMALGSLVLAYFTIPFWMKSRSCLRAPAWIVRGTCSTPFLRSSAWQCLCLCWFREALWATHCCSQLGARSSQIVAKMCPCGVPFVSYSRGITGFDPSHWWIGNVFDQESKVIPVILAYASEYGI